MIKKFIISTIFLLALFLSSTNAQIAVFPFEDLSKDVNGLDLEISTQIAKKLIDLGYDVIFPMEIIFYLEKNNIPFTGWIDVITAKKIEKIFKTNLILLGTVLEKDPNKSEFGVTVRLLLMPKYKLIWAKTFNFKKSENITILNLRKKNWDEIIKYSMNKLFKNLPEIILTKAISPPDLDVENILIEPRYTKTGNKINLKISLKFSSIPPKFCTISITSKEKKKVIIKENLITLSWKAPKIENRYPVTMECYWEKPLKVKKKIFLSTYYVDNTPPKFKITLKYSTQIGNTHYFSKYIKLIPYLKIKEKISKWQFKVIFKKDNKTVAQMHNYGKIPAYLIWKGNTVKGATLPNGRYLLNLTIWDRAGNKNEEQKEVYLVKTILPPKISSYIVDNTTVIKVKLHKHPVNYNYFRIELFDSSGRLIASKFFEKIPENIEFKLNKKFKKIYYSIDIRDILGNRIIQKKIPLFIKKKEKKIIKKRKIWINEF